MVCTSALSIVQYARLFELSFNEPIRLVLLIGVAAVIIIVSVKLILALFISPKNMTNSNENIKKIVLKNGESGNIMVSSELVKDIAIRCAKTADDVRDVDCKILCDEQGVKIMMKYYLKRDIPLDVFLSEAQTKLKEYIETNAGINVLSIDMCADINQNTTSRLR